MSIFLCRYSSKYLSEMGRREGDFAGKTNSIHEKTDKQHTVIDPANREKIYQMIYGFVCIHKPP